MVHKPVTEKHQRHLHREHQLGTDSIISVPFVKDLAILMQLDPYVTIEFSEDCSTGMDCSGTTWLYTCRAAVRFDENPWSLDGYPFSKTPPS